MKRVRYSVQVHPQGFAVMELCQDCAAHGACRFELWCQCVLSDGGPLRSLAKVVPSLDMALEACAVLEAALGDLWDFESEGSGDVRVCDGYPGDGEVPY